MATSVYKTKYAQQIRWALDFAQKDVLKLWDEQLVPLADDLCKFVSTCDGFGGAHPKRRWPRKTGLTLRTAHLAPPPTFTIGDDLLRAILGVDPFSNPAPVPKKQKKTPPPSPNVNLQLKLIDISQDFHGMFSPVIGFAKQNSRGPFPIEISAHFGSICYQVLAKRPDEPLRVSQHYVSPERFPGDALRQYMHLALVLHLARSKLTPEMFRKCPQCSKVFLPTRVPTISEPFCSHDCAQSKVELSRPARGRADWRKFKSFLKDAEQELRRPAERPIAVGSHTKVTNSKRAKLYICGQKGCLLEFATEGDRRKHWEWDHERPQDVHVFDFVDKQLPGGWKMISRWIAFSRRNPAKELWKSLSHKTKKIFRGNWSKLGQI